MAIDPATITSRQEFGEHLTALREEAKRPLRDLATRIDVPASTIGGWLTGRHLPNLRQVDQFRGLLAEIGVQAVAADGWVQAAQRLRPTPGPRAAADRPPYRGLEAFGIDDADWFFGRAAVTQRIVGIVDAAAELLDEPRIVVVVGASGAGKSSVLRAGVAAALARRDPARPPAVITPGNDPFAALGRELGADADALRRREQLPTRDIVAAVIVDQFEEIYVHGDASAQGELLDALLATASEPDAPVVVLALRADFYGHVATNPALTSALQRRQVVVTGMTGEELRDAIVEPAKLAGISIEPALVELVLRDVTPAGESAAGLTAEPGALPLVSHALLETWRRSRRNEMLATDYIAAGGLHGAVEQTAEAAYLALPPAEQELARVLFLRLVSRHDSGVSTRRVLELDEIAGTAPEIVALERVMLHFVGHRLLTIDATSVELSHEALIGAWSRLRAWTDEERDEIVLLHQLRDAARVWHESGSDESALLSGTRLNRLADFATREDAALWLGPREAELIRASLDGAQRRATLLRRRRRLIALLVAVALVAGAFGVVSGARRDAAERERNDARSRRIALQATQLATTDPSLGAQLALVAYETAPTAEARTALLDTRANALPHRVVGHPGSTALATTADGSRVATSDAVMGTISVRSVTATGASLVAETAPPTEDVSEYSAIALSPDGSLLVGGATSGAVSVWSLDGGAAILLHADLAEVSTSINAIAFSPDGAELAVGTAESRVLRWDIRDPLEPQPLVTISPGGEHEPGIVTKALAYAPDGGVLAVGTDLGDIRTFRRDAGDAAEPVRTGGAPSPDNGAVHALAYSPDGSLLAAGHRGAAVLVYPVDGGSLAEPVAVETSFTTQVNAIAFNADGTLISAAGSDSTADIWQVEGWRSLTSLPHAAPVTGVVFAAEDHLVTVSIDGNLRLWPLDDSPLIGARGSVYSIADDDSGARLAVFSGGGSGAIELWDASDPDHPTPINLDIPLPEGFTGSGTGVILPDGNTLVAGSSAGPSVAIDITDPTAPELIEPLLEGPTALIEMLAVSPDGRLVAVGSDDMTVHLWDMTDPSAPTLQSVVQATNQILGLAFDPTSHLLAAASADLYVYLWDVADPTAPKQLARLGGFENYGQAVAFSDDGTLLAGGSADKTVRVWDISDPSAPVLVAGPLTGPRNYVYSLDFQPGTRVLAVGANDATVWLWDLTDPAEPEHVATLAAPERQVFAVSFTRDGQHVLASGADRLVYEWNMDIDDVADWVCAASGDPISSAEWAQYLPDIEESSPCS